MQRAQVEIPRLKLSLSQAIRRPGNDDLSMPEETGVQGECSRPQEGYGHGDNNFERNQI